MTTLVYEQLKTIPLIQEILIEKRIILKATRLYLYKTGFPIGGFKLIAYDDTTIFAEKEITFAELITQGISETYFHGRILFEFDTPIILTKAKLIKFKLVGINGYTYNINSHIGWVKMYERKIAPMITQPVDFSESPYGIELYDYEVIK